MNKINIVFYISVLEHILYIYIKPCKKFIGEIHKLN